MATRAGRPRSRIDRGEFLAAFARMTQFEREQALEMMTAIHEALSVEKEEPESSTRQLNSMPTETKAFPNA